MHDNFVGDFKGLEKLKNKGCHELRSTFKKFQKYSQDIDTIHIGK